MIRKASNQDITAISELALKLWPYRSRQELKDEFTAVISSENSAVFLSEIGSKAVGFAQCQLRNDYVEGTRSNPVGYLEGIFVEKENRHCGIARELLRYCEQWARSMGCTEFASDCELNNEDSFNFHRKVGFAEANRIICFIKKL
ncbi:MAG TPA: GNAT family N-acetyltransferase [Eubacteriales bacterium]|nr:GNAT family N-acetyltransferase [Eubacteriales bacterium]